MAIGEISWTDCQRLLTEQQGERVENHEQEAQSKEDKACIKTK